MIISYSSRKKKNRINKEKEIEEKINKLEETRNGSDNTIEAIEKLKDELEECRKEKMRGVLIRTKARWIEDGEKPSKYFCNLEKRNYVNKTVTRIVDDNGIEITDQKTILETIKQFYKKSLHFQGR